MNLTTAVRSTGLAEMKAVLEDQHTRKLDVVAPTDKLWMKHGVLSIEGVGVEIDEDGVTETDGLYRPTRVFDEGISDKLKIPLAYLRRMVDERVDLYDANVNGWLLDDPRKFLIRCFKNDTGTGVARSIHSDKYGIMDNLDVLVASLQGINEAGVEVQIDGCDLTERRMFVRVKSEAISVMAPTLLKGYRSPFTGASGSDNPTVFAGFVISNSETGNGAFSITPRLIVQVCNNGMTIKKDAMRGVHLGKEQGEGQIVWSQDTVQKELAVVTARARDSIKAFLAPGYLQKVVGDLEEKAGVRIKNPAEDVLTVTTKLGFDKAQSDAVFSMFIEGGQLTAGGVMQAVTAAASQVQDADRASDMEGDGIRALELAAAL